MTNAKIAAEELAHEVTAKIMIVDDHPMVAATLARVLKNSDMAVEILIAEDGVEALRMLQDSPVDILITDFLMPRMTGLELGKNLRELVEKRGDPNSPYIILMTAYGTPDLEVSARQLEFNEFLVKPINPKSLRDIVYTVLEQKIKYLSSIEEKSRGSDKFQLLVADDIPENIRLLTKMVSSDNYDYLIARDGQEALDVLRKELPDLVLLDINMPKLNGFEVLKEMRADPKTEHIPVIIITAARITSSDIEEGLILGADDYVTKPINWRELSARIKTKLRVKEQSDKLREKNLRYDIASRVSKDLQAKIHEIKHHTTAGYFDSGSIKSPGLNEVIKIILDKALSSVGAATGSLTFANADGGEMHSFISSFDGINTTDIRVDNSISKNLVGKIFRKNESLLVEDIRKYSDFQEQYYKDSQAVIAIPLPSAGEQAMFGAMILTHPSAGYFDQEHIELLQAIVDQAVLVLENTRNYVQEKNLNTKHKAIQSSFFSFNKISRLNEFIGKVPELIQEHFGYPLVCLWLIDEKQPVMHKQVGVTKLEITDSLHSFVEQAIFKNSKIIHRETTYNDKNESMENIAFPITAHGKPWGALSVHMVKGGQFEKDDLVVIGYLNRQLTYMIENILMIEKLSQGKSELEQLINSMGVPVFLVNKEHQVVFNNRAGENIILDNKDFIANIAFTDASNIELQKKITEAFENKNVVTCEVRHKSGKSIDVSISPVGDDRLALVFYD